MKKIISPDIIARRQKRAERRALQRAQNSLRAREMRQYRKKHINPSPLNNALPKYIIGCSGWYYWHLRDKFYKNIPQKNWFQHYTKHFDTVEINASFYSWPKVTTVKAWLNNVSNKRFLYTVKVCEHITHIKKFKNTKILIQDFDAIADILNGKMGCFLYQFPPSFKFTKTRLANIVSQLNLMRRNVIEFRHASWWNETVYDAFRKRGIIFCSQSAPKLPDELIKTADEIYVRFHGKDKWYRHFYTKQELTVWVDRIEQSKATRVWAYFNNDHEGYAVKNAETLNRMLKL